MRRMTLAVLAVLCASCDPREPRGVGSASGLRDKGPAKFERAQSAALFVGVRRFAHDRTLNDVRYAVDDAVGLAYTFAMDGRVGLVLPRRVILALSGEPQKASSQKQLAQLRAAGARVENAGQADILNLLRKQAAAAGEEGLLVIGFASHGFSKDGSPYLLSATSLFRDHETALSAAKIFDIASSSKARRSLIFVDACRERIAGGERGGADPASAAPLIEGMTGIEGQVVLYAAAAGKYAYDDVQLGNGVFTNAVLDGLSCKAQHDARGFVTVETLARYVDGEVRSWLRKNRDPEATKGIQVSTEGMTDTMPLANCAMPAAGIFTPEPPVVSLPGTPIDLDEDGANEAIAQDGSGRITVWRPDGTKWWSTNASRFVTGHAFSRKRHLQLVALAGDTLTLHDTDGRVLSTYVHATPVQDASIVRRTAHHAPKILLIARERSGEGSIALLDPKKSGPAMRLWQGTVPQAIEEFELIDHDHDGKSDITLSLANGKRLHLNFDGEVISSGGGLFRRMR